MTQTYNADRSKRVSIWLLFGDKKVSMFELEPLLNVKVSTLYSWHRKGILKERTGVEYA